MVPATAGIASLGGGSANSEFLIALRKKKRKREKAVGAGADVAEPPLTGHWTLTGREWGQGQGIEDK